jgi:ketosteroid isomerase-like protein
MASNSWCHPLKKRELARRREAPVTSGEDKNKELARRFMEARIKGDLDAVDEMLAPDFVNHTSLLSVQEPDREGLKRVTAQLSAAVSNASVHIEDQIAAGDKVVTRSAVNATHDLGELMGVAPSGRELDFMPVFIHRIEGGEATLANTINP